MNAYEGDTTDKAPLVRLDPITQSVTSPCLRAGAYSFTIDASGPVIVTASGATSWRVVLYSP